VDSFGYYPEGNPIMGSGKISYDDAQDYAGLGNTSQSFSISEDQAQAVRDLKDQVNNGTYTFVPNILGDGNNCASFVSEAMQVAGVDAILPFKNILPWWSTYAVDLGGELGEALVALNPELNSHFLAARGLVLRDPLAIDLDGDGIETVGTDAGVLFDHNADGVKTGTGWVVGDDALVVLDRDGNGLIDSGRELFGIDTAVGADALGNPLYAKDGFDALASLDANGDTLFDANDTAYADVRLWRDVNQDGVSQSGELQSLADAGISAIDLAARQARQTLAGGNVQTLAAGVAGIAGSAVALDLASNPFYRDHPDSLDTTAVADLPDMQGCGSLRDLKEAATQSGALETQLRTIASQGYVNRTTFQQQVKTLIDAWADTSAMQTWAQREALAAQQSMSWNPNAGPATSLGVHTLANAGAVGMEIPYFNIHIIYQPQGVDRGLIDPTVSIGSADGSSTGTLGTPGDGLTEAGIPESRRRRDGGWKRVEAANGVWKRAA
jgi:hypothetical protein